MKVLKIIGFIIIGLLALILLAIYLLPDKAHMQRSIYVEASPHQVYLDLVTYRNFNSWSPWIEKDPEATYSIEGPEFGVGAKIMWESTDRDYGDGSMEIVEVIPDRQVTSVLKFDDYDSSPYGTFILQKEGDGCRVTWTYDEYNIQGLSKIFMLGIDGFLGRDWELALERLKKRVEAAPIPANEIMLANVKGFKFLGKRDTSMNDPELIATRMNQNFEELMDYFSKNSLEPAGHPITIITANTPIFSSFICGIPIMSLFDSGEDFEVYESYEGLVAKALTTGGYETHQEIHQDFRFFLEYYGYGLAGDPWEEYIPASDNSPQQTAIFYPLQ